MRAKDIAPIFHEITQVVPDLAYHKRLMFKTPLGQVLRGIHFDPSAFSRDPFNVTAFVMPFCVPTDYYHFTFGIDLRILGEGWSLKMPDLLPKLLAKIREDALPFFDKAPTLEDLVPVVLGRYDSAHGRTAGAYALARIGETRRAVALIEDYLPKLDLSSHWEKELAEDARALRHMLIYEPELAAAKLEEWETGTIRALGLDRFR